MKDIIFLIIVLFMINTINSCDDVEETFIDQGYVIGFDPCKKGAPIVPNDSIRGLLIELSEINLDTLLTYNLPWTLFDLPDSLFESYRDYYYFPEYSKRIYKMRFTYRYAKSEEKRAFACIGDIFAPGFEKFAKKQIIILSAEIMN